jgi:cytochrome c
MSALVSSASAGAAEVDGEVAYNNHCRKCHSLKPGDNRLGPSLFGIVGAKGGQVEGFSNYSGGLSGITWELE